MALCVRKLDRKSAWLDPSKDETWLGATDLRADALQDISTKDNKLSIYEISEQIPLERILAALAAKRAHADKIDFILFDSAILNAIGINRESIKGDTYDDGVNAAHVDLIQLTATKLAEFGGRIRAARPAQRCYEKKLLDMIRESVDEGFIDRDRLTPSVAAKIGGKGS